MWLLIALAVVAFQAHVLVGLLVVVWVIWIFALAGRSAAPGGVYPAVHRCWNCGLPVPLSAARCPHCGVRRR
jgi:hypothetical protein